MSTAIKHRLTFFFLYQRPGEKYLKLVFYVSSKGSIMHFLRGMMGVICQE